MNKKTNSNNAIIYKSLILLLMIAFFLLLGTTNAYATENYDLWVGSTRVTSDNQNNVLGDGKVSYNPNTSTLIINDVTLTGKTKQGSYLSAVIFSNLSNLIIQGSFTIKSSNADIGILSADACNVTLQADINCNRTINIGGDLIIESGIIVLNGASSLWSHGEMIIKSTISKIDLYDNGNNSPYEGYIGALNGITIEEPLVATRPSGEISTKEVGTDYDRVLVNGELAFQIIIENPLATKYNLWVGNTQVTDANKNDVLEDGTVSYDSTTNTITLNNAIILGGGNDNQGWGIKYLGNTDLNIVVSGNSMILSTGIRTAGSAGIVLGGDIGSYTTNNYIRSEYTANLNITINEGQGLMLGGGETSEYNYATSCGICLWQESGNVTINGAGDLYIQSGKGVYGYGISAPNNVVIDFAGKINISGTENTHYNAGISAKNVTINNGDIDILPGETKRVSIAILAQKDFNEVGNGNVKINGGTVTATGGIVPYTGKTTSYEMSMSYGILADGNIQINGGTLIAKSLSENGDINMAMNKEPILTNGIKACASPKVDVEYKVPYLAIDNDTYKWFKAPTDLPYSTQEEFNELIPDSITLTKEDIDLYATEYSEAVTYDTLNDGSIAYIVKNKIKALTSCDVSAQLDIVNGIKTINVFVGSYNDKKYEKNINIIYANVLNESDSKDVDDLIKSGIFNRKIYGVFNNWEEALNTYYSQIAELKNDIDISMRFDSRAGSEYDFVHGEEEGIVWIYKNGVLYNATTWYLEVNDKVFPDVLAGKWYTDGIAYCKEKGIMNGYADGNFGINDNLARGQIVLMFYRLAGTPSVKGLANPFEDVDEEKYFTDAVKWAVANNITTGKTATTFDPYGNVTRQELAVFMARYAKNILGKDITSTYNITGIADYNDLSTWARPQMQYIMENEIITGDMKLGYPRILPRDYATRAMAATMFSRFCQKIAGM